MAVGVIIDLPGATLDQYDEMIEKMGCVHGGMCAPDAMFHWVAATEDGIRAVDVWESREAFDRFAREQIVPLTQEVHMQEPPQMTFYEVHCTLAAPRSYS